MAKTKILVVDDEEDFAKALKIRLKANGYEVVLAHDSIQAVMMADQERPDLIIVDIKIPGEDGYRFTERLKRADATRPIPIVFLTGVPGGEGRAYQAGAWSYLMKPYDPKELLETIHDALQKKGNPGGMESQEDHRHRPLKSPLYAN